MNDVSDRYPKTIFKNELAGWSYIDSSTVFMASIWVFNTNIATDGR
jgi:hypothetical protein